MASVAARNHNWDVKIMRHIRGLQHLRGQIAILRNEHTTAMMNDPVKYENIAIAHDVAGVMAIFFLNDTSGLNRNKFRALPVLLLFSLVYDFLWIFLLNDREKEGKATEKGLESNIISFSIYVSYANMFFKVSIMLLIV